MGSFSAGRRKEEKAVAKEQNHEIDSDFAATLVLSTCVKKAATKNDEQSAEPRERETVEGETVRD